MMNTSPFPLLFALDALTGALFLLTALGVVATRQVLASLQLFILQSLLLTIAAVLLGIATGSYHLFAFAAITIATKTLLIPWLLRHTVSAGVYRTREIERVLNIPSSLLLAAGLIVIAYAVANQLLAAVEVAFGPINLPLGLAAIFLGAFTIAVRREAVPQLLGLLGVENGVFFAAGIVVLALGTQEIAAVRGLARTSPVAALALVLGGFAIAGAPPFAVFVGEFLIFKGGLASGQYVAVALLAIFVVIAFSAVMVHVNRMAFGAGGTSDVLAIPASCRATLALAALPLLVIGVYVPSQLRELLAAAAKAIAG